MCPTRRLNSCKHEPGLSEPTQARTADSSCYALVSVDSARRTDASVSGGLTARSEHSGGGALRDGGSDVLAICTCKSARE